jgi:DNA-directed RNA polymerase I, II, and III subunit RPABC1
VVSDTHDKIVVSNGTDQIIVCFVYDPKVSVKKIKSIKEIIDAGVYTCLILVYKSMITAFAKQFIVTDVNNLNVQVFSENELSFNITKHALVPKHEVLSTKDRNELIRQYRTTLKHFPLMLSSDPVARYYGALPGTMMKITRKSPTAGEYVLYRVVI